MNYIERHFTRLDHLRLNFTNGIIGQLVASVGSIQLTWACPVSILYFLFRLNACIAHRIVAQDAGARDQYTY